MAEELARLAEEFRTLPPRDRRAVLKSLSPFERSKLAILLERDVPAGEPSETVSPWLKERLREAEDGAGASGGGKMTPATRQALLRLAPDLGVGLDRAEPGEAPDRRSLLGAVGDLLLAGRPRR